MTDMFADIVVALGWHGISAYQTELPDGTKALAWRWDRSGLSDWLLTWDGKWCLSINDPIHGGADDIATIQNLRTPSSVATWVSATVSVIKQEAS